MLHGDGPLLILAGAGSGKTRALTHRIVHLIRERGVDPRQILAVTFTNKAAGEMRQRVIDLLAAGVGCQEVTAATEATAGISDAAREHVPWVSTFHSFGVRVLRREIGALGYSNDFVIYDDKDQERLLKDCLSDYSIDDDQSLGVRAVAARINAAKNRGEGAANFRVSDETSAVIAKVFRTYEERMQRSQALDFGDLLVMTVRLFEECPNVAMRYQERFCHVLVDEYQDTNAVQYRLTQLLALKHRNLCVVGDDDQSIYRWRGAEIGNILNFERDFPNTHVIRLEQNYRSTAHILNAAGAVVACNSRRKTKTLWTENAAGEPVALATLGDDLEEARFVASEIRALAAKGRRLRDIALFYRTNAQSRSVEESLARNQIPYAMVGGVKFFARAEVKDLLAFMRLCLNPADTVAAKRIVNVPPRGIGAATVAKIGGLEDQVSGGFLGACRAAVQRDVLRTAAAKKVQAFLALMDSFRRRAAELEFPRLASTIIEESGYGPMLRDDGSFESRERLQNLEQALSGMEERAAGGETLRDYLEQVALVTDLDGYDAEADRVTLMTLHAAKGLEFPVVFMVGMEEGLFPHARVGEEDIEEERRLCYVGMTRAMSSLYLTHARRRRVFGDFQVNQLSRFVEEVPREYMRVVSPVAGAYKTRGGVVRRGSPHYVPEQRISSSSARPLWLDEEEGDSSAEPRVVYDADEGLQVGCRVRHASFGVGVIRSLEGSGEKQKVTVLFRNTGAKKLLLRLAGLEPA